MPNIDMLIDSISQHLANTQNGQQVCFSAIDLNYAYSHLQLHKDTAKPCNVDIQVYDYKLVCLNYKVLQYLCVIVNDYKRN